MSAWWSGAATAPLAMPPARLGGILAAQPVRRFRLDEPAQQRAWNHSIAIRQDAPRIAPGQWHVVPEFGILRPGVRADAVLVGPRGLLVLDFEVGATRLGEPA